MCVCVCVCVSARLLVCMCVCVYERLEQSKEYFRQHWFIQRESNREREREREREHAHIYAHLHKRTQLFFNSEIHLHVVQFPETTSI